MNNKIIYHREGDYFIPDLCFSKQPDGHIGMRSIIEIVLWMVCKWLWDVLRNRKIYNCATISII